MAGGTGLFARAPASDASWNPATDLALATNYDLHMRPGDVEYNTEIEREVHDHVAGKAANKLVTQREYGLDEDPGAPLVGFVADLSDRASSARPGSSAPSASGADVLLAVVPNLVADGFQVAVHVSPGDERLEASARRLAAEHPGRAAGAVVAADDAARRRVLAGADLLAVAGWAPDAADARAVACRYGAVPVSKKTGAGIWNAFRKKDGIEFESADADGVRAAFGEAASWFRDENKWAEIRARAMDNAHVTRA